MKITHVSIVGYGVMNFPEGFDGWQFVRIEYFLEGQPYQVKECHIWLPPEFDTMKFEDEMNEAISANAEKGR